MNFLNCPLLSFLLFLTLFQPLCVPSVASEREEGQEASTVSAKVPYEKLDVEMIAEIARHLDSQSMIQFRKTSHISAKAVEYIIKKIVYDIDIYPSGFLVYSGDKYLYPYTISCFFKSQLIDILTDPDETWQGLLNFVKKWNDIGEELFKVIKEATFLESSSYDKEITTFKYLYNQFLSRNLMELLETLKYGQIDGKTFYKLKPDTDLSKSTELHFDNNKIKNLPVEILFLKNLMVLTLSYNHLTHLPPEFGSLRTLTRLDLSCNKLTSLPEEIEFLTALTTLNLGFNYVTELTAKIGFLTALTDLDLRYNDLTRLPKEIGFLRSLIKVYLSKNQLATLPITMTQLVNLTTLNLSGNPFCEIGAVRPEGSIASVVVQRGAVYW